MRIVDPGFQLYDTTLRDGVQQEGMALSVADKLAVARLLDEFGVDFIEGGWPGAIPKDTAFFQRARTDLELRNAQLVAFGATRRPDLAVTDDPQVRALLDAETSVVTLVAKSDLRHVELALRTTGKENLAMLRDTVRHLTREGRRVMVDAEHFFDGFQFDRDYATAFVKTAVEAGAEVVVLCDTNGGSLPNEISDSVATVAEIGAALGIHCHDDAGCAVANSLFAVAAGAVQIQATAHGYGERCGNANLFTLVADLAFKTDPPLVASDSVGGLESLATAIGEITNVPRLDRAPYVGRAAFAHKAGLHASAIRVDPNLYQHIEPELVGNSMRTLVSDQAGRASIELKARELGYDVGAGSEVVERLTARIKELEESGYTFDGADASFELLLREELNGGELEHPFAVDSWGVQVIPLPEESAARYEATATFRVHGEMVIVSGLGTTAPLAMEQAVRLGLGPFFDEVRQWVLNDCRICDVDDGQGGTASTRTLLSFTTGSHEWCIVGVAEDRFVACWTALQDAARYAILRGQNEREDQPAGQAEPALTR
jgi:2-isopropylmalate synthase